MSKITTLLVGGAGFIGQSLVRCLLADGRRTLRVLGRSRQPREALPPEVGYIQGDATDSTLVDLSLEGVDEVVDLAYATVPKTSYDDPLFDVTANLSVSVNLQLIASKKKISRYLLVSSGGTVYGQAVTSLPIRENHPTDPISPYGISKLVTEKYASFFRQMSSLPVIIVRPSNPFGRRQIGKTAQGFIGAAVAAIRRNVPIEVYGQRGTIRDYIDIEDLADGLKAALDLGRIGEVYNIGTGIGTDNQSVVDLIRPLAEADGLAVEVNHLRARDFDVRANVLDPSLIFNHTGWRSKVPLGLGIDRLWHSSQFLSEGL